MTLLASLDDFLRFLKQETLLTLLTVSHCGETPMLETIPTEEQRIKLTRRGISRIEFWILAFSFATYMFILGCLIYSRWANKPFRLLVAMVSGYCFYRIIRRQIVKYIARGGTAPDQFENEVADLMETSSLLQEIVAEKWRMSKKYQLLRPSLQPQDETLLRAATSTNTAPQEQLLRPSQTEE